MYRLYCPVLLVVSCTADSIIPTHTHKSHARTPLPSIPPLFPTPPLVELMSTTAAGAPGPAPPLDPKIRLYGGTCSVAELAQLRLGFHVTWPLSMLLDDNVLQQYNAVTVFLMQVWWVLGGCVYTRGVDVCEGCLWGNICAHASTCVGMLPYMQYDWEVNAHTTPHIVLYTTPYIVLAH